MLEITSYDYQKLVKENFKITDKIDKFKVSVPVYSMDTVTGEQQKSNKEFYADKVMANDMPVYVFLDPYNDGFPKYIVKKEDEIVGKPEYVRSYIKSNHPSLVERPKKQTISAKESEERKKYLDIQSAYFEKNRGVESQLKEKKSILEIMNDFGGFPYLQFNENNEAKIVIEWKEGHKTESNIITKHYDDDINENTFHPVMYEDDFEDEMNVDVVYLDEDEITEFMDNQPLEKKAKEKITQSFVTDSFISSYDYEELIKNELNHSVLDDFSVIGNSKRENIERMKAVQNELKRDKKKKLKM